MKPRCNFTNTMHLLTVTVCCSRTLYSLLQFIQTPNGHIPTIHLLPKYPVQFSDCWHLPPASNLYPVLTKASQVKMTSCSSQIHTMSGDVKYLMIIYRPCYTMESRLTIQAQELFEPDVLKQSTEYTNNPDVSLTESAKPRQDKI